MYRRLILAASVALVLLFALVAGCAPARTETPEAPSMEATPESPAPGTTAEPTSGPAPAPVRVRIATEKGDVDLELYPAKAPQTVENYLKLAASGFYDGIRIHRVEDGFVVQAGDPQTKELSKKELRAVIERQKARSMRPDDPPVGNGGPGWSIPLEISDLVHDKGVIAMARSQEPDSAGSQFYITLNETHQLDGSYAVFGRVTSGMEVVERLAVGDRIESVRIVGDEESE